MAYNPNQLTEFVQEVAQLVPRADIRRRDWKRQTDAVRLACVTSQMWAEDPERVFLVDGRIETGLIREALNSGSVRGFFNQRCHDKKLKCRRVIVFDTKSGNGMDEKANKLSNLHFHAIFLLNSPDERLWLMDRLRAVFGSAPTLRSRQFWVSRPDRESHHSFAGRRGVGISGKICYMLSHAGTTHASLNLNAEGRRSRKAPATRRSCNVQSKGLAAGKPSNFLSSIVICDNASKREAQKAFEAWMDIPWERQADEPADAVTCHDRVRENVGKSTPPQPPSYAQSLFPWERDLSAQTTIPF